MARNDDIDIEDIDDNDPEAPSQLRAYAKRQGEKAAKVSVLEKENALLRAGIDTSTRKGQAFLATTTVDLNDTAAIVADAMEFDPSIIRGSAAAAAASATTDAGTTAPSGETGAAVTPAPEPTGTDQRNALSNGATPSGAATEDIVQGSMDRARKAMAEGASEFEAMGSVIAERSAAVMAGKLAPVNPSGARQG